MEKRCYVIFLCVLKLASTRVISNGVPNRGLGFPSNSRGLPNQITLGSNIPNINGLPAINQRQNGNNLAYTNIARPSLANTNNLINTNVRTPRINTNIGATNLASANEIFVRNNAPAVIANQNLANTNLAHNIAEPRLNLGNIPLNNYAGLKPKAVNLNIGHPNANSKDFNDNINLQILADELEIRGAVSVAGKMPFNGVVALDGRVPSGGLASVQYSCGSQKGPV